MRTLDDIEVKNKTVLLRVDLNEPVNRETGELTNIHRIRQSIKTIKELTDKQAKVVILTHQGSDIEYKNFYSTKSHAKVLSQLLNKEITYIPDIIGPYALNTIQNMKPGEAVILENVRYLSEEQTLFEKSLKLTHAQQTKTILVQTLSKLADIYVNDAFSAAHRDQPSLCAFPYLLPSAIGRQFEQEIKEINSLIFAKSKNTVFVLGGAKIDDALDIIGHILENDICNTVLTGGLVGNLLLIAKGYNIGEQSRALLEKRGFMRRLDEIKAIVEKYKNAILTPIDLACVREGKRVTHSIDKCSDALYVDIGEETVKQYDAVIQNADSVFVNGPMGIFEETLSEYGTKAIWESLSNTKAHTIIGGGDSLTATAKYNLETKMDYLCTGGGALIQYLSGKKLPVIKALEEGEKNDI